MATLTVRSGSDGFDHIREIPANWWFERTGATGRERSRTNRTQEVAGSSPASSTRRNTCRWTRTELGVDDVAPGRATTVLPKLGLVMLQTSTPRPPTCRACQLARHKWTTPAGSSETGFSVAELLDMFATYGQGSLTYR
jgi:hypothetical protein